MDFQFSSEQELLKDSLYRMVEVEYGFETRKALLTGELGWSPALWQQLAAQGVLGLRVPEAHGGLGAGATETMIAMMAVGHGLLLEPVLPTAILGVELIARLGSEAQQAATLPAVMDGSLRLALAHEEPGLPFGASQVALQAVRDGAGYRLRGHKAVVAGGAHADQLLVSARLAGAAGEPRGLALFRVPATADGVSITRYRTIDGPRAADVLLQDVAVSADARLGGEDIVDALESVLDLAAAAVCAEAVAIMARINALTLEYLKTRQQFGQPIGRFQVLQHRMVDMVIAQELAKAAMRRAFAALDAAPAARRNAVAGAKIQAARSGRTIAQQGIQLHGGMGMMNEVAVSHYAKRLTMIETEFGDAEVHLDRYVVG